MSASSRPVCSSDRVNRVHLQSCVRTLIVPTVKRVISELFATRSLLADKRANGSLWPKDGQLHRSTKRLKRRCLEPADHILTLIHAS